MQQNDDLNEALASLRITRPRGVAPGTVEKPRRSWLVLLTVLALVLVATGGLWVWKSAPL